MSSCLRVVHSTTVQQLLPILIEKSYFYSLNKNQLKDLELLLDRLKPNQFMLEHLSLLSNPLCPHPISEPGSTSENLYQW